MLSQSFDNNYISLLLSLSDEDKLTIIESLSRSMLDRAPRMGIHELYGSWVDDNTPDHIIEQIRQSRRLGTRDIIPFD